jgi:hypothetical protein
VLQEFDTRLLHGDTARVAAIMSFGGSVRNQLQNPNFSKRVLWVIVWCVPASAYFALHGRHRLTLSPEEFACSNKRFSSWSRRGPELHRTNTPRRRLQPLPYVCYWPRHLPQ